MPIGFTDIIELHKDYLSIGNNTFHYIYDCVENQFEFLSDSFTKETGYAQKEALYNPNFILTSTEDIAPIMFTLGEVLSSFISHFRDHIEKYTIYYHYPLLHKDGNKYPCLNQVRVLDFDQNNQLYHVLAYNQIQKNDFKLPEVFQMNFISSDINLPSFYNIDNKESLEQSILICQLSNREKEILKLVSEGDSNNIISEKLNISVHTISTHKKNIVIKTNTPNIMVAIQKAILQKIF